MMPSRIHLFGWHALLREPRVAEEWARRGKPMVGRVFILSRPKRAATAASSLLLIGAFVGLFSTRTTAQEPATPPPVKPTPETTRPSLPLGTASDGDVIRFVNEN